VSLASASVNPLRCGAYRDLWVSASSDGQRLDVGVGRLPGRDRLMTASSAELRQPGCDFVDGLRLKADRPGFVVYVRLHRNATGQCRQLNHTLSRNW